MTNTMTGAAGGVVGGEELEVESGSGCPPCSAEPTPSGKRSRVRVGKSTGLVARPRPRPGPGGRGRADRGRSEKLETLVYVYSKSILVASTRDAKLKMFAWENDMFTCCTAGLLRRPKPRPAQTG